MASTQEQPTRRPRPWLHLLWLMPAPLALAGAALLLGSINLCGLGHCDRPGYGWAFNVRTAGTLGYLAFAVVVTAVPAALVPWNARHAKRWIWSFAAALALIAMPFLVLHAGRYG
ncbi:hypothetical protein ACNI3K_06780 [Demequina sp. SO4-13]|uniref:hypothetical protein n=1 Tax=Demequina sp. SO4-13 TaxID=3401027 RepID=UPI003AF94A6A